MKNFDEIMIDCTKYGRKIKKGDYLVVGKYPIIDQGQQQCIGFSNEVEGLFTDVPAIIFGDHTRIVKYIDKPFYLGADGIKVLKSKNRNADYRYLYYAIRNIRIENTGYNRHFKWLKESKFRYPELKQQQEISSILWKVERIIELKEKVLEELDQLIKSRFVEMFGDPEVNPYGWEKAPLSRIIKYANNGMARRGNNEKGNIVIRLVELRDSFIDYSNPNRILLQDNEKDRYLLKDKDFLFARVNGNPDNVGRCALFHEIDEEVYHNDHIIRVHFKEEILDGTFASIIINSPYGKRQLKTQIKTSAGQYTISQEGIGSIMSIIPPIELQNQFANFAKQVDKLKIAVKKSLDETQKLFDSLMQDYFG